MAHIPYGYRIERGKAVIVPEEAMRIRAFLSAYLDGMSIKASGEEAEIPLRPSALNKMLRNELYLGTDYYPAIIDRDIFGEVQKGLAARTHEGQSKPAPITPTHSRFTMAMPDNTDAGWMSAADTAAWLYSLIAPAENGHFEMTPEEKAAAKAWREQIQKAM